MPQRSPALAELSSDSDLVDTLDVGAIDRMVSESQLETVEFGWVVGAGDLDSTRHPQLVLGPVSEGRRDDTDVNNVEPTREEPLNKRGMKRHPAGAIVPSYNDFA